MLEVKKIISYKIDGGNITYFDYLDNFSLCLPELLNDNVKKLFCYSANNYFNDKYNIKISKMDNIYEKLNKIIDDKYELMDNEKNITDCIVVIDKENKKYGFANLKGEIVIPCIYDSVCEFINGLAKVVKDGEHYFINKENTMVYDTRLNKSLYFEEFALDNACLFYPKHIRRFETLRSLSHPESCKKSNAWSYCFSNDKIYLVNEYNYQFLIIKNGNTLATINEEERISLIKSLKNI